MFLLTIQTQQCAMKPKTAKFYSKIAISQLLECGNVFRLDLIIHAITRVFYLRITYYNHAVFNKMIG